MVAETLVEKVDAVWLFLRDFCSTFLEHAGRLWSLSDWQVRVCFILAAMLFLNVFLIGIAWHHFGGVISEMYSSKAIRKTSVTLLECQAEIQEVIKKKTD